jgi:hypothetical protein
LKLISEYVSAEYKQGGDIRSSIINERKITVPVPPAPLAADPKSPTQAEQVAKMIFKGEIDAYIKRKSMLDDNIQKTYSLVIGQCADLIQSKLKQQAQWTSISQDQDDAIVFIGLTKTITFRFEDQKFLPLALYLSKARLYNNPQGNMANHDCLQRFQNFVDVATSYNGQLCDQAIVDIVTEQLHPGVLHHTGKWLPCRTPPHGQYWSFAVAGLIIMCVPPNTWNIAHEPLLVAIYLIIRHPYSKEASRPQRKQLLPLVLKEAISKEAFSKEAISKEAIPKGAIPKEAILNAPTSFHPLPPIRMRTTVHTIKYLRIHTTCVHRTEANHARAQCIYSLVL